MVRYVNPPPEGIACSEKNCFKSSICQPKDSIGISCVFSAGDIATRDKPSTGVRRKYAVPKDNLGIACLPTSESMRLRDIPEVSECDSSEEIYPNAIDGLRALENQRLRSTTTKLTGRAKCNVPKDNLSSSCRPINGCVTFPHVRLRAGGDSGQNQYQSGICGGSKIERVTEVKLKGNEEFFDESERFILQNKKMQHRSTSLDIGISNIRRPKHDPTQPRKPIVPKDNIGFSGRHLQKSSIISSGPTKTSAIYSLKKTSSELEKKEPSSKSLSNYSETRTATGDESLKANRRKPK